MLPKNHKTCCRKQCFSNGITIRLILVTFYTPIAHSEWPVRNGQNSQKLLHCISKRQKGSRILLLIHCFVNNNSNRNSIYYGQGQISSAQLCQHLHHEDEKRTTETSSDLNSAAAPIPSPRATTPLMGMRSGPAFNEYDF